LSEGWDAQVRRARENALCERQDAFYVELLANRFLSPLNVRDALFRVGPHLTPRAQNRVCHHPHEAWSWLQTGEFGDEQLSSSLCGCSRLGET